jgi:carbon storage regulator
MLVLTRKVEESVLIGDNIEIKVLRVKGAGKQASIRLGIVAPEGVRVLRKEVLVETAEENRRASRSVEIPSNTPKS